MTQGRVHFIAQDFPGKRFRRKILTNLMELVDKTIIYIIDLVIIQQVPSPVTIRNIGPARRPRRSVR